LFMSSIGPSVAQPVNDDPNKYLGVFGGTTAAFTLSPQQNAQQVAADATLAQPKAKPKPPPPASSSATAASFAAPPADSVEGLLLQIGSAVSSLLGGGGPQAPATQTAASSDLINQAKALNITKDPQQKAELDRMIETIAQDPEGAALLQKNVDNKVTFEVGDPGKGVNGVTISGGGGAGDAASCPPGCACAACATAAADSTGGTASVASGGKGNRIIVSPNAQDGIAKTLLHEFVHGATLLDGGSSKDEEGVADAIGFGIGERTGLVKSQGLTTQQAYQRKKSNQGYANLAEGNNVRQALAQIGIDANEFALKR
jgi:hypothetical protein